MAFAAIMAAMLLSPPEASACSAGGTVPAVLADVSCSVNVTGAAISNVGALFGTEFAGFKNSLIAGVPDGDATPIGVWARGFFGSTLSTTRLSATGGAAVIVDAQKGRLDSRGFQIGADIGRTDIGEWSVHVGVTAGALDARPDFAPGRSLTVQVPFAGLYAAAIRDRFHVQSVLQRGFFVGELTDPVFDLAGAKGVGSTFAWSGSVGWTERFGAFSVEPTAGFSLSRLSAPAIPVGGGPSGTPAALIAFSEVRSTLGFVGLRANWDTVAASLPIRLYGTATMWNQFEGDNVSVLTCALCGAPIVIRGTRPRNFGEFGLGVAVGSPAPGWVGFVRADAKAGPDIEGWTVTGGLRRTF
ncbi:MAG: autotransporter outer membrane beta-barrel domain-containing protein [Siculibacillus sp.]|nr:autotransporter outer membrane beta-barrel domain-containing protein [Siculibacillus sp.]